MEIKPTRYGVEISDEEERRRVVELLTQTGVVSEELCEPLAVLFAVAAVAAVAERRHADFRGPQVVWGHHRTCRRKKKQNPSLRIAPPHSSSNWSEGVD